MKQITLSIDGITKELELVGNNKKVDSSYHLIEGDWYREIEPTKKEAAKSVIILTTENGVKITDGEQIIWIASRNFQTGATQ